MKHKRIEVLLFFLLLLWPFVVAQKMKPIDRKATAETKALFNNLHKLAENHTLFGHHNATE